MVRDRRHARATRQDSTVQYAASEQSGESASQRYRRHQNKAPILPIFTLESVSDVQYHIRAGVETGLSER